MLARLLPLDSPGKELEADDARVVKAITMVASTDFAHHSASTRSARS
jgi:hypothetical protein